MIFDRKLITQYIKGYLPFQPGSIARFCSLL